MTAMETILYYLPDALEYLHEIGDETVLENDYKALRSNTWSESEIVSFLTRIENRRGLSVDAFGVVAG